MIDVFFFWFHLEPISEEHAAASFTPNLVFRKMVNLSNMINYLATQMNNETSFKQHNKERFIIVAGIKEWEWESIPFVLLVSMLILGL